MSKFIREDSQYLCEVCRSYGVYNYDNLEVHHITKVKDDPSRLLDRDNLICLCRQHHKMADKGKIGKATYVNL
jgi:5-methylcytosine-specific restriction endonuclease McrA